MAQQSIPGDAWMSRRQRCYVLRWHKVVEHAVQTRMYILITFIGFTENGGRVELFTTHKSLRMRLLTTPLLISVRLIIDL